MGAPRLSFPPGPPNGRRQAVATFGYPGEVRRLRVRRAGPGARRRQNGA